MPAPACAAVAQPHRWRNKPAKSSQRCCGLQSEVQCIPLETRFLVSSRHPIIERTSTVSIHLDCVAAGIAQRAEHFGMIANVTPSGILGSVEDCVHLVFSVAGRFESPAHVKKIIMQKGFCKQEKWRSWIFFPQPPFIVNNQ